METYTESLAALADKAVEFVHYQMCEHCNGANIEFDQISVGLSYPFPLYLGERQIGYATVDRIHLDWEHTKLCGDAPDLMESPGGWICYFVWEDWQEHPSFEL